MSQVIPQTYENKIDDELALILKQECSNEEQQLFLANFEMYLSYGRNNRDFVIDLDKVYKWVGYSSKSNAKRAFIKNFEINTDYVIQNPLINTEERFNGGQNKEQILMTIDTFKTFCMMAKTKKGKLARQYYIKLEKVVFNYLEHKNQSILGKLRIENKINLEKQKEKTLLKAYKDNPCVYILKVSEINGDNFVVKIGETDDISTRIISLRTEYKNCVLINSFLCRHPHKFEQFLLKKPDIKEHRLIPTEMIQISEKFTYNDLLKIIEYNVDDFQGYTPEQQLKNNYSKEKQLYVKALMLEQNEERKKFFQEMLYDLKEREKDIYKNNIVIEEDEKIPDSNRRVYKYNKDDLTKHIDVFNSLKEAARSLNNPNLHDYHIRNTCLNNTIFCDFRWFLVDNSLEVPENIPETVEETKIQQKRIGLVAQINETKDKIINVHSSQSIAAKTLNVPACSITYSISSGIKSHNFYWKMYEDCDEELKKTFQGKLPKKSRVYTSSKQVQRLDPSTHEVLETYPSIQVMCNKYKTSHKFVHKLNKYGDIYKGYVWKIQA